MNRYPLDTNVVSELRKPRPHGSVVAWLKALESNQLFVSAVALGELQAGIELTRKQDPIRQTRSKLGSIGSPTHFNSWRWIGACFRECGRLMHEQSEMNVISATSGTHDKPV